PRPLRTAAEPPQLAQLRGLRPRAAAAARGRRPGPGGPCPPGAVLPRRAALLRRLLRQGPHLRRLRLAHRRGPRRRAPARGPHGLTPEGEQPRIPRLPGINRESEGACPRALSSLTRVFRVIRGSLFRGAYVRRIPRTAAPRHRRAPAAPRPGGAARLRRS